jgi:predicted DCC family thiol-disulfide oxidoreductase YuxK
MTTTPIADPTLPKTDPARGKAVVLFDGSCPFCRRSVAILQSLDWFDRLHVQNCREKEKLPPCDVPLEPKRLIEEMHVVTPDRKKAYAGFAAFRWMAWRLPILTLAAPFLYLPGVPWLGNKAYLWVAKNRFKLVPCTDGVCELPKRG